MAGLLDSQPVNGLLGPISPETIRQVLSGVLIPSPDDPNKPAFVRGNWGDAAENARRLATQTGNVGSPADWAMAFMGGPRMGSVGAGIRAYHGSPHDFERFDLSRIGTGEGAQSYGHGLYFAENPGVAADYRRSLAKSNVSLFDPLPADVKGAALAISGDKYSGPFLDKVRAAVRRSGDWRSEFELASPELQQHAKVIDRYMAGEGRVPGYTYEVNINAKPEQFLDWDKPVSQQGLPLRPNYETQTGQELYRQMQIDKRRAGLSQPVEDQLLQQGIPGIKYLDQGSRAAGDGTSNYVVFNDKLIDILRKFGLAGMLGGGTIAANPQPQQ